jgi:hypothetical protein
VLALCWFPLVHRTTYVSSVGLNPDSRAFAEERKRFVIDLILNGVKDKLP